MPQTHSRRATSRRDHPTNLPKNDPTFFRLESATDCASRAADQYGLPQTVFITADTNGWWHTNAFATVLSKPGTSVHVTMMPSRYWS